MFATLFFGVLQPSTGVLTYTNAGHEPPLLIGAGGVRQLLEPTGPAVGFMAESAFGQAQVCIEPGELVFAYTDGITEARGPEGGFFGEEPLMDLLNCPASSAAALMEQVQEEVGRHIADSTPSDDITMLAVRRRPQ
jgi:serine phosphatase RsbU (regulator of sigma subunit)